MRYSHILLLTFEYPPFKGGVARYAAGIASMFSEDTITVLVHDYNEQVKSNVIRLPLLYKYFYPRWIRAVFIVRKIVKEKNVDLIITPHILPGGLIAYYIKKLMKVPYCVSLHGTDILLAVRSRRKKRHAKKILHEALGIVTNSSFTKSVTVRFMSPEKSAVCVLHPSANQILRTIEKPKNLRHFYNIHEDAPVLITVGRLIKRKGIDLVLEALTSLTKKYPDLMYFVVGEGREAKNLRYQVNKNRLDGHVHFIGKVTDDELANYYSISDIFVMPARHIGYDVEGFGTVFLEAGLFSLPVIGTKTGGISDAIVHEKTGLLIPKENVHALYGAIDTLLKDTTWRRSLGEAGKKHAAQFTWEHNKHYFDVWFGGLENK